MKILCSHHVPDLGDTRRDDIKPDNCINIGNRMNASAFRDLWARVMS